MPWGSSSSGFGLELRGQGLGVFLSQDLLLPEERGLLTLSSVGSRLPCPALWQRQGPHNLPPHKS